MKKSTKKTINYLRRYIGHEIIRIKPTLYGDWSFTGEPILLRGFTKEGCMVYDKENEEGVLSISYTDRNWISYNKALKAKGNQLNKWKGKEIKRICPTFSGYRRTILDYRRKNERIEDYSFMCRFDSDNPPILVSASKHHIVLMLQDIGLKGIIVILGSRYSKEQDWTIAE